MATVLVADDERPIRDLLIEFIEDVGHTALGAHDGTEAFILAQRYLPALIISDVMMPLLDGYSLVIAVRADVTLVHTAIILLSATFDRNNFPTVQGATCMPKPLNLTTLEEILAALP